jgi:hypothetical protein
MFIYLFYGAKVQRFIHVVASEITRKLSQIAQNDYLCQYEA